MNDDIVGPSFENIGQLAVDMVSEDFARIWIRCRHVAGTVVLMVVYQPIAQPFCYKDGTSRCEGLVRTMREMTRACLELRQKFVDAGEQPLENMTLTFNEDGAFGADFGYEDFDDKPKAVIELEENWNAKYLGSRKLIE